jgi:uncharacterized protein YndB with AHSA1/START domain
MQMQSKTQHGYLLLADISDYTAYVARTELEHAQEIIGELLELVLHVLTPTLTLSKLEGDAVFAYAPENRLARAETVMELIELTYVSFRDRVEGVRRRTTCDCNTCRAIPALDLKFIAHHGDFVVQTIAGMRELIGSDVNLVHRLSKNHVADETGWKGYALYTEGFLQHLDGQLLGLHEQVESYEHLGDVRTLSNNLRARYEQLNSARRIQVGAADAEVVLRHDFSRPPAVVWEWLNDPQLRTRWMHERVWSAGPRPSGRTDVGSRNHCAHGKYSFTETILDWKPFDYVTSRQEGGGIVFTETVSLEPLTDSRGTRLLDTMQFASPLPRLIRRPLMSFMVKRVAKYKNEQIFRALEQLLNAEAAAEQADLGKEPVT